jgi:ABC-2 type transport system ATP-binding protein
MPIIDVNHLKKSYNDVVVVNDISFSIEEGTVFGFLGPNGAGKTTTLEIMEGLRNADSGTIEMFGKPLHQHLKEIQDRIGVQLQSSVIDERIKVREVLELFKSYYSNSSVDIDELLQIVNLVEKQNDFQKNLSGGQKQRLSLALCLVNDPDILFLDEPTTGLDPQARRNLWDVISKLKEEKKTIILTTHYMDEAERLCDQIAIIDHGQIIKAGTPDFLINQLDADRIIEIDASDGALETLKDLPYSTAVEENHGQVQIYTNELSSCLDELLARKDNVDLDSLHIRKATLEDVFIHLTGRSLRD